jgi:cytochrome P450
VNLDAEMAHVTADIIFRAIFSQPLTQQASRDVFDAFARYQEALPHLDIVEILGMPDWIPRRSLRKAKRAARPIRDILRSMIEPRLHGSEPQQQDILGILIDSRDEQGGRFQLEELVDEVAVLFLAGHETSASALSWAIYLTSQQPDIEQRLVAEAGQILGTGRLRFEDINRLALTRNVFKEALRLYPPVSFITREAREERHIGRWRVRRNSMMVVSPWVIHRHRNLWQQPDCFIPDRYDQTEASDSERQAYLPFGNGPRACPGASFAMLEGPLILASLFHRFRVVLAEGVDVQPVCRLTTRPSHRILVKLRARAATPGRATS